jgi:hypothetical protein
MSYGQKERGIYPAVGKAVFTDTDAYFKWYLEDGGYGWLREGDNFKDLIHERQSLFTDMVQNYHSMYCNSSASDRDIKFYSDKLRKIDGYIEKFGGKYDVLLHEPVLSVIQFGEQRYMIPSRFLTVMLYPDYNEKALAELNRALISGGQTDTQPQPEALSAMGSLSVAEVNTEIERQKQLIAAEEEKINALKEEQERKIAAIKEEARLAMQKIERMKLGLQATVEDLKTKIFMLESVIYSVECYLGDTVDFIRLRKGEDAPVEAPLVVHQKLRYLDEDLPIMASLYGFSFEDSKLFEEALMHRDDMVEYFCPGDKCMSFVRVSKTGNVLRMNEYGMLDEYEMLHGKTIGILLRNGENLYFGWTDEAKIILPDGNVFYTPKTVEIDPEDTSSRPEEVQYPSSKYSNDQIEAMTSEEKKELEDNDQIAYHMHQRGLEKRKILAKAYIFAIIQGLLDNTELVKIPEKVHLLKRNSAGSRYIIFSNADGWLEDNRYGDFSEILKRYESNHKEGDVILSTIRMSDGQYNSLDRTCRFERSIDGSARTHDCSVRDGEFHKINLVKEYDANTWRSHSKTSYFISLEKEWSEAHARSNFEIDCDEFINMTFLNSEWLHYAILNKKIGRFVINSRVVDYAHAVRYLKLAYEYLQKRETEEQAMICEHVSDLQEKYPAWMVALSEWKEEHNVRRITPYQAKRFAKWLTKNE